MICPSCKTENRDERAACYHCEADLVLLRTAVIASRHLFNRALEHAGRGRNADAMEDLRSALELDASFGRAWVVLGTLLARDERFAEAEEAWRRALKTNDACQKAHEYLRETAGIRPSFPAFERLRSITLALGAGLALAVAAIAFLLPAASQNGGTGMGIAIVVLGLPLVAGVALKFWPALMAARGTAGETGRKRGEGQGNGTGSTSRDKH